MIWFSYFAIVEIRVCILHLYDILHYSSPVVYLKCNVQFELVVRQHKITFMKQAIVIQKLIFLNLIFLVILIAACRKETNHLLKQDISRDNLRFFSLTEKKIRINQAIVVYDSTQLTDSIDFVNPPTNKYYEWQVLGNNGCDSIVGEKNKGKVTFIFYCSGMYMLTANIYDPSSHALIGATDTLVITVTSDTLQPVQSIQNDDVLNMKPSIGKMYSNINLPPDKVWIGLVLSTTKLYYGFTPNTTFNYTSNINFNSYSYTFSNIKLNSYPYGYGQYNIMDVVWGEIELDGLSYGVPADLNITWLGITYTGKITLVDEDHYTIDWNNSGAVKVQL